jgi:hypothetical protein
MEVIELRHRFMPVPNRMPLSKETGGNITLALLWDECRFYLRQ